MTGIREPTEMELRRLRLARRAFGLGLQLTSGHPGDAARIGAVVQFDFAAETAVKVFLHAIGDKAATADLNTALPAATKHLEGLTPPVRPDGSSAIGQVRRTRNAAQHEARVPTLEEVQDARATVHLFFRSFFDVVWGVDFDQADVDEISAEQVRKSLEREGIAAAAGDYTAAAGWTREALENTIDTATAQVIPSFPRSARIVVDGFGDGPSTSLGLTSALRSTHRIAALVALGIDPAELVRLVRALDGAPMVNVYNGTVVPNSAGREFLAEEAAAVRRMAIDLILRSEQRAEELLSPPDRTGR